MKQRYHLLFLLAFLLPSSAFALTSTDYILQDEGISFAPTPFLSDDFSLEGGIVFFEGQREDIFLVEKENTEENLPVHSAPTESPSFEEVPEQVSSSSGGSSGGGWRRSVDTKKGLAKFISENKSDIPSSVRENKKSIQGDVTSGDIQEYEDFVRTQREKEKIDSNTKESQEKEKQQDSSVYVKILPFEEEEAVFILNSSDSLQKEKIFIPSSFSQKENEEKNITSKEVVFSENDLGGVRKSGEISIFQKKKKDFLFQGESYDPLEPSFSLESKNLHAAAQKPPTKNISLFFLPLVVLGLLSFLIWRKEHQLHPWKVWKVGKK